ncbi:MAG: zinc ribbon domain-containing protein [Spirochaetales bacterium]|nr:zinc ribbon domain-containing protein [Spirochaetales bacterium]
MPTYEYECRHCHHRFEQFQSITEDPIKRCPKCGRNSLRRLFGGGLGIIFKGSGFYTTDYKRSSAVTSGNGKSRPKSSTEGAGGESSAGQGAASSAKEGKSSASGSGSDKS